MRLIAPLLVAVAVLAACGGDDPSPTSTARAYVDRVGELDLAGAAELLDPVIDVGYWTTCITNQLNGAVDYELIDPVEHVRGNGLVEVRSALRVTAGGETITLPEDAVGTYRLTDGVWLLQPSSAPDSCLRQF